MNSNTKIIEVSLVRTLIQCIPLDQKLNEDNIKDELLNIFSKSEFPICEASHELTVALRSEFPDIKDETDVKLINNLDNSCKSLDVLFDMSAQMIIREILEKSYLKVTQFAFDYEPKLTNGNFYRIENEKEGELNYNRSLCMELFDVLNGNILRVIKQ